MAMAGAAEWWIGMPRSRKKKRIPRASKAAEDAQLRPGMPAADTVKEVTNFVSPQGKKYEILRTNETDAYDPPLEPAKRKLPSKD